MDVAIGIAGVDYGNCLIEATEGGGAVAHVTIGESQYIVGPVSYTHLTLPTKARV